MEAVSYLLANNYFYWICNYWNKFWCSFQYFWWLGCKVKNHQSSKLLPGQNQSCCISNSWLNCQIIKNDSFSNHRSLPISAQTQKLIEHRTDTRMKISVMMDLPPPPNMTRPFYINAFNWKWTLRAPSKLDNSWIIKGSSFSQFLDQIMCLSVIL